MNGKLFTTIRKRGASAVVLSLLVAARGAGPALAQNETGTTDTRSQQMANQGKFACNAKALSPAERAHHKQLTEKLLGRPEGNCGNREGLRISIQSINSFHCGIG